MYELAANGSEEQSGLFLACLSPRELKTGAFLRPSPAHKRPTFYSNLVMVCLRCCTGVAGNLDNAFLI